jgi:hypothetical protein
MLHNLIPCIKEFGSLLQFSTKITEYLHRPFAQDTFNHRNSRNSVANMCWYLDQKEKMDEFEDFLQWWKSHFQQSATLSEVDKGEEPWIVFTKQADSVALLPVDSTALIFSMSPNLCAALADFYSYNLDANAAGHGLRRMLVDNASLPFSHINVWHCLQLTPPVLVEGQCPEPTTVCNIPVSSALPGGQFNTVLIHATEDAGTSGLKGTELWLPAYKHSNLNFHRLTSSTSLYISASNSLMQQQQYTNALSLLLPIFLHAKKP